MLITNVDMSNLDCNIFEWAGVFNSEDITSYLYLCRYRGVQHYAFCVCNQGGKHKAFWVCNCLVKTVSRMGNGQSDKILRDTRGCRSRGMERIT